MDQSTISYLRFLFVLWPGIEPRIVPFVNYRCLNHSSSFSEHKLGVGFEPRILSRSLNLTAIITLINQRLGVSRASRCFDLFSLH